MTPSLRPLATVDSVLELVGRTPLLRLHRFAPQHCLFAKLEYLNPGGSVKDRIGVNMIRQAEREGKIQPGRSTIIEPTAGNTGVGLAMAARQMGYRCILCVPTKYSREKMMLMKALGAELVLIPKEEGMKGAIAKCAELAQHIPHAYVPQQFEILIIMKPMRMRLGPKFGNRWRDAWMHWYLGLVLEARSRALLGISNITILDVMLWWFNPWVLSIKGLLSESGQSKE